MRRVIFNQKGGVGKTTITCNLAAISAAEGKKTLVIDLDPQCNSTQYLLSDKALSLETSLFDYFNGLLAFNIFGTEELKFEDYILKTPFQNLYVMPSHPDLDDLQYKLESRYKMFKLKKNLDELQGFDYIYIDTPPALNFYSRSAVIAANYCLIPFDCDNFSRNALYRLLTNVGEIKCDHNPDLEIEGIVVNQYQSRAKLPVKIVKELIKEGMPVLKPYLSSSIKIKESHEKASPMIFYEPKHKLTTEYIKLYKNLNNSNRKN